MTHSLWKGIFHKEDDQNFYWYLGIFGFQHICRNQKVNVNIMIISHRSYPQILITFFIVHS